MGFSLDMRVLTEQIEILAPHQMVWAALEDFGGVSDWAPYMNRSKLVGDMAKATHSMSIGRPIP
jgi:carbon monoxide dehydrogenase subunit G